MKNCHPCESSKTNVLRQEYFYLGQQTNGRLYHVPFSLSWMLAYAKVFCYLPYFPFAFPQFFYFWVAIIQRRKATTEEVDQIHCCDQMIAHPHVTLKKKKNSHTDNNLQAMGCSWSIHFITMLLVFLLCDCSVNITSSCLKICMLSCISILSYFCS